MPDDRSCVCRADTEFAIDHIADNDTGEMYYEKVTIEMIQY